MNRFVRMLLAGLAVGLVIDAGVLLFQAVTAPPEEGTGSSYAVGPDGLDRWADLLAAGGHTIERQRRPFDLAPPEPGATLVIADRRLGPDEVGTVRAHVRSGSRLLLIGEGAVANAQRVGGLEIIRGSQRSSRERSASADPVIYVTTPAVAAPEVSGVGQVESLGGAVLVRSEGLTPLLTCGEVVMAGASRSGDGEIVVIADSSPISNGLIHARDNAVFAQQVVGPAGPVVFAEHLHGHVQATGLGGLPANVKAALLLVVLAGGLFVLSRRPSPRSGAEELSSDSEAAEALERQLGRLGGAAHLAQAEARGLVVQLAHLPREAGGDDIRRAASALGLDDATASLLVQPVDDRHVPTLARTITDLRSPNRST